MENIVETRTSCSNNLMADEAVYHKECLTRFMLNWTSLETKKKPMGHPVDENMLQSFEMLCIWLELEADAELYTATELHTKMTELANGEAVYSTKWLKTKLKEKYKDSLYFAEINGRSDVVCFSNMINCILNDKWCESRKSDKTKEVKRIVITAAKIKQNSIGQTIVYSTRQSSVIPPIPFGAGIEMDHIFGSRWFINELSRLGFSISYDKVNRYKQSVIANNNIIDMQIDLAEDFARPFCSIFC